MKCLYEKQINKLEGQEGETRTIIKFLLFPKTLNNKRKWLGHAKIKQMVCEIDIGGSMDWSTELQWRDIEWID